MRIGVGGCKTSRGQCGLQRRRQEVVALTSFCVNWGDFQVCNCDKRPQRDKNQEVDLARGGSQGVGIVPIGDFEGCELWPGDQEVAVVHSPYPAVPSTASDRTTCNMRRGRRKVWRAIVCNLSSCCEKLFRFVGLPLGRRCRGGAGA